MCQPAKYPTATLRATLLAAALLLAHSTATRAAEMIDGVAVVTSEHGRVKATLAGGKKNRPGLHQSLVIDGSKIETGNDAHLFLALSNGVGMGIDANTRLSVISYKQAPFPMSKEGLSYEPSTSSLLIHLETGMLAIASDSLSPLSQMRVQLIAGEVRIHSANCVLQQDDTGMLITVYDGTLTYYYPDGNQREFIAVPQSVRISEQSAMLGRLAEDMDYTSQPERLERMAKAAQHANRRVFFRAPSDGAGPPEPVLIASPDYFKQAPARPYEYRE